MLGATGAGRFQGPSGSQHHQQQHPLLQPAPSSPSTTTEAAAAAAAAAAAPSSSASTSGQRCATTALWPPPPPLLQSHHTPQPPLFHPQLHQLQQQLLIPGLQQQQQQQTQPPHLHHQSPQHQLHHGQHQQQQHQQTLDTTCSTSSSTSRTVIDLHANGEISETLFSHPGGYPTPASPFVSVSPLELVAKNFHATAGSLSFSQANSIFVQSDYIGGSSSVATKKTCFGSWEQGLEPLHIQIKREPCQVSEITTSHPHLASHPAVVKIEPPSPKHIQSTQHQQHHSEQLVTTIMDSHQHMTMNNGLTAAAAAPVIPVGIAVARQRPQDHASSMQPQLTQQSPILGGSGKDQLNRFGTSDFGTAATSAFSQNNMFFAGTAGSTMLPSIFPSDALTMGVSNMHNSVRNAPPTLWQYPTSLSVESMMPMPMLPAGLQLVRDPTTGQIMVIPAASTIDPFQPAVVWPTYSQPATMPAPHHLLMPNPMMASMQPQQVPPPTMPPLHMLSGSDYLGSTTLHQHTQTHSTRLVALTGSGGGGAGCGSGGGGVGVVGGGGGCGVGGNLGVDLKRHHKPTIPNNIPLPMQPTTLIKIEDCSSSSNHHHHMSAAATTATSSTHLLHQHRQPPSLFEPCHSNTMHHQQHHTSSTITTAVQSSNEMGPTDLSATQHQLFYQSDGNLIQIAPHTANGMLDLSMARPLPSPMTITRCIPSPETPEADNACGNLEAAIPDVQDANIQTDSPPMSEDDSATGTDECPNYPTDFTQRQASGTNAPAISYELNHQHPSEPAPAIEPQYVLNPCPKLEISFGTQTTTDYSSETISDLILPAPVLAQAQHYEPAPLVQAEPVRLEPEPEPVEQPIRLTLGPNSPEPSPAPTPNRGPDLSGLELLSNSIEAFEKHIFIKKEPGLEAQKEIYRPEPQIEMIQPAQHPPLPPQIQTLPPQHQPLPTAVLTEPPLPMNLLPALNPLPVPTHGGLEILCALAEQRFQEEVGSMRSSRKRSSSSEASESTKKPRKHHKEKHSSKKSSKRSKHRKERRDRKSRSHNVSDDDELVKQDLSESFNRVRASLGCASCSNGEPGSSTAGCCREKCNWPTAEEVYIAMNSDMRNRLANVAKEVQEEKRKLSEIKLLDKSLVATEAADSPMRSVSSVSDSIACDSVKTTSDTESFGTFRFDDGETNSSASSKRKSDSGGLDVDVIANKKVRALVENIFATKNRTPDRPSVLDETSLQSSIASIKQEVLGDHEDVNGTDLFGGGEKQRKSKHSLKHKKAKSSKERKHRRSTEVRERKRRIDSRCTLTGEHLFSLGDKTNTRVLTAMGGLFYAGCLSAIQPPDVYAVTLDGERGNRPHIMSREEILRDAILEVAPTSVDEVLPGARLCAYWSQQYRCLYPGTAAPQDVDSDSKFIVVEFDDGDSGRIAIEDIRFLLSEYPIVEYDPNPLLSLNKRNKQRGSQSELDTKPDCGVSSNNCFRIQEPGDSTTLLDSNKEASNKERRRLKKLRKDQLKQQQLLLQQQLLVATSSAVAGEGSSSGDLDGKKHRHKHKCGDEFCKHRKHKKRRKHHKSKHHHRDESSQDGEEVTKQSNDDDDEDEEEEDDFEEEADDEEATAAVSSSKVATKKTTNGNASAKEETMPEIVDDSTSNTTESELHTGDSTPTESAATTSAAALERQISADNSKIAAFLPARQLWAWSGKGVKRGNARGRVKKQFFKAIQRGKETISIGDSAVFLSTGRPDRPYIGRIESFWETTANNRVVRVKWYYHPEETVGCPDLMFPGGLFQSPHADENDVQTISHKCQVKPFDEYVLKFGTDPTKYGAVYDNNDTFYKAGYYDPTAEHLTLEEHIPKDGQCNDDQAENTK